MGYGEGGQLTEAVRRKPSSVVVLDEIDKASREVVLLQVLEEGRLTDGKGRHVDFSNTVVILTTNLGAEAFSAKGRALGFGSSDAVATSTSNAAQASDLARESMPPELWNRIDERCAFKPLEKPQVARIATLLLTESSKRLRTEKGIEYVASDDVILHLLSAGGFDLALGARPMRQTVQRLVEGPLAERILAGDFEEGDRVRVECGSRWPQASSTSSATPWRRRRRRFFGDTMTSKKTRKRATARPRRPTKSAPATPKVVVVGFGRLGGAICLGLKAAGWVVSTLPRSEESVRRAVHQTSCRAVWPGFGRRPRHARPR